VNPARNPRPSHRDGSHPTSRASPPGTSRQRTGPRSAGASRRGHFAGPSNRFWPALHAAGITPERLAPQQQDRLPDLGVGITNLAPRPSARAAEVTADELRAGARRLEELVARIAPRVVAILGVGAYRVAFSRPRTQVGEQPERLADARLWVLHNPSGLNAHARPADHAAGLRQAAEAAGIVRRIRGRNGEVL
jgi:double-stranded uracil-DNA glycosylase